MSINLIDLVYDELEKFRLEFGRIPYGDMRQAWEAKKTLNTLQNIFSPQLVDKVLWQIVGSTVAPPTTLFYHWMKRIWDDMPQRRT